MSKPEGAQARVLAEMGFEVTGVPQAAQGLVQASREFDFVSHENLSAAISGDTIFLLAAEPEDVQAVLDDPVLANLPAVKAGRVYPLGGHVLPDGLLFRPGDGRQGSRRSSPNDRG